jgi:N6-L-threonylcarbamoyladenine synthase
MPTTPRKARILLKEDKAKVVKRTPFTVQLKIASGENKQDVILGVDSGFKNVGLSAVTDKEEVFSADATLRDDIVKLMSERRMYRRNRRGRKTWYRKPRFLNRVKSKHKGWLAPSIQHKLDSHKKLIEMVKSILPITKTVIEVAAFDIQKIRNPEIFGEGYQNGEQKGFWNVREYVFHRDGHKCQAPKCRHKDPILNVHHIESRQTGGDSPANLITLCESCHKKHHKSQLALKVKPSKRFKAETFMSMVRWRLTQEVGATHTFGYITKSARIALGLSKSHINDAFAIAEGSGQKRATPFIIKQVRKCNRKLFKGARSHIRNTAAREVFGFRRFDKVAVDGQEGFVFGRRNSGHFAIRTILGETISNSISWKKLGLLERARTLLISRDPTSSPGLNAWVSVEGV